MHPDRPRADVPPGFQAVAFDYLQCRRDLDALDTLLSTHAALEERRDILPFFRARPHLALGRMHALRELFA